MFKQINYIILISLSITFAVLFSLALLPLIPIGYWKLLADGFIGAVTFILLAYFMQLIKRYGNYSALTLFQRTINYSAIGLLMLAILLSVDYGLFYLLFGEKEFSILLKTVWVKGFVAVVFYLLVIQYFHYNNAEGELPTDEFEEIEEKTTEQNNEPDEVLERIAVKSGQKIDVILIPEIIYLQAEGDYVKIFTEKGKYLKEETMKYFQEHLPLKQFVRIHRSYIVNVEKIQKIDVYEKQNQLITLKSGEQIKASIAGYKQLKIALNL